jgi:hypothetical protein
MPTLRDRVVKLEGCAKKARENIAELREDLDGLSAFVDDEAKLRAINDQQIKLLRQADAIHERRLRSLAARVAHAQRRRG